MHKKAIFTFACATILLIIFAYENYKGHIFKTNKTHHFNKILTEPDIQAKT